MKNRKGAIELSMTTIVIVVLSLTLLIMGFVLIRNIMCGAISLTQDINKESRKQVLTLFGSASGSEVVCIGQGSEAISIFPESPNWIMCSVRAPEEASYEFTLKVDDELSDIDPALIRRWLLSTNKKITISPGDEEPQQITRFNIPGNAPEGNIVLNIEVRKSGVGANNLVASRTLSYQVTRKGVVRSVLC